MTTQWFTRLMILMGMAVVSLAFLGGAAAVLPLCVAAVQALMAIISHVDMVSHRKQNEARERKSEERATQAHQMSFMELEAKTRRELAETADELEKLTTEAAESAQLGISSEPGAREAADRKLANLERGRLYVLQHRIKGCDTKVEWAVQKLALSVVCYRGSFLLTGLNPGGPAEWKAHIDSACKELRTAWSGYGDRHLAELKQLQGDAKKTN